MPAEDVMIMHAVKVCLFVAFHDGKSLPPEDIIVFMKDSLAKYKIPKYVKVLTALPRNGTGKILRNELKL